MHAQSRTRSTPVSRSGVRSKPVSSLAALYAKPHYMGDHPLFHNAITAKRFPALANVPGDELAGMFNVDPVDREEVQREELMYYEPHRDKPVALRELPPLPPDAVPFRPANASEARQQLVDNAGSIFVGFDADADRRRQFEAERAREAAIRGNRPVFSRGTATEAQQRICGKTYLNSLDEDTVEAVRRATERRLREKREAGLNAAYGYTPLPSVGGSRQQSRQQSRQASRQASRGAKRM